MTLHSPTSELVLALDGLDVVFEGEHVDARALFDMLATLDVRGYDPNTLLECPVMQAMPAAPSTFTERENAPSEMQGRAHNSPDAAPLDYG